MRVIYFSRDYSSHDHRFLQALSKTAHDVHYLRLERSSPPAETRPVPESIGVIDWWGGRRVLAGPDWLRAVREIRSTLTRIKPDLVHAGPVQSCAFLAALAGARPLVTMSWGSDLLRGARRGPGRWTAAWTLRRSQAFAGDCQAVRQCAQSLGVPSDATFIFPWGVDLNRFHPGRAPELRDQLGIDQDAVVFLSARTLAHAYGLPELMRAFIEISPRTPQAHLLVLGQGPLHGALQAQVQAADLNGKVHFVGQVAGDELPAYYRAADVYVTASHSDGSSVALMEALASGLPAIASDIPGNLEWVADGGNGWTFPMGNSGALGETLNAAAKQRQRRQEFAAAARRTAEDRANWERNFPVLLQAYEYAVRGQP